MRPRDRLRLGAAVALELGADARAELHVIVMLVRVQHVENGNPSTSRTYSLAMTSGFGLGFAVRTSPPPNTTWPLGEYRWDGAGGSFYFVDPQDDMLVICMVQAPTQGGRIQLALKTIMFEALGKGLRKD